MKRRVTKAEGFNTLDHAVLNDNAMTHNTREYGLSDMNWKDTGNEVTDPSMKGYNEGYQDTPYEFFDMSEWTHAQRNVLHTITAKDSMESLNKLANGKIKDLNKQYFASRKHPRVGHVLIVGKQPLVEALEKTASDFLVTDYGYLPEQMAREFLTIWNGVDSPIQDFYNGFVMNRFTNEMRAGIADALRKWGYEVTPVYEDRTPRYARNSSLKEKYAEYIKLAEEAEQTGDAQKVLDYFTHVFPQSYAAEMLRDCAKEVREKTGLRVTLAEAGGLADYYKAIYPDDYANALIDISLDKGPFMGFKEFIDLQLTNQDMEQIEKYDSENQDPSIDMSRGPAGAEYGIGGNSFGWNPTTDLRSDTGFPASSYETTGSNRIINRIKEGLKKK